MTQEQMLARLLVCALHKLGGHLEVTEETLEHMGHYNIVWEHSYPIKDQVGYRTSLRSGEILIGSVDEGIVSVVL